VWPTPNPSVAAFQVRFLRASVLHLAGYGIDDWHCYLCDLVRLAEQKRLTGGHQGRWPDSMFLLALEVWN
jgi:hypothetical protein